MSRPLRADTHPKHHQLSDQQLVCVSSPVLGVQAGQRLSWAKRVVIYHSHFIFHDTRASAGLCALDTEKNRNNHKDLILYWSKGIAKSLLHQCPRHWGVELIGLEKREQRKAFKIWPCRVVRLIDMPWKHLPGRDSFVPSFSECAAVFSPRYCVIMSSCWRMTSLCIFYAVFIQPACVSLDLKGKQSSFPSQQKIGLELSSSVDQEMGNPLCNCSSTR